MYRTNALSRAVEDACIRNRVPYRLIGGVRFYQRREIKDVLAYLRLVQNRHDEASLLRVINVPGRGIGDRTVHRLREFAAEQRLTLWDAAEMLARGTGIDGVAPRSAAAVRAFVHLVERLREGREGRLSELLESVLSLTGYRAYIGDEPDSDERRENIDQLRSVVSQYEDAGGEQSDLSAFLEGVALVADVDELKEESQAITLITFHAAKGLEFPVVFMIGMEEAVLPHIRSFDDPRQMEEERRLAYVGITRAKDLLYLTRAYRRFVMGGHSGNPASRFLSDIPKSLVRPFGSTTPRSYLEAAVAPVREEPPPPRPGTWKTGDRVVHPKFGSGMVISAAEARGDIELVIAFEGAGIKKLSQAFAPLSRA